jgi:hypothetical protein
LGFLGRWPFRREDPNFWLLDFLGFPWILSSESRLINGLRGINGAPIFHAASSAASGAERDGAVEAMRRRRIIHESSLILILIFRNELLSEACTTRSFGFGGFR